MGLTSDTSPGSRFAATFAALLVAHHVADYWLQTEHQAVNKGRHGSPRENAAGRAACLAHVSTYSAATASAVAGANRALRLGASWRGILVGQAISAVSHYWADRRFTLRRLAEQTGRLAFYDQGEGLAKGSAVLDQSWHIAWLALSALATAAVGKRAPELSEPRPPDVRGEAAGRGHRRS
jgi:hypothetical protein